MKSPVYNPDFNVIVQQPFQNINPNYNASDASNYSNAHPNSFGNNNVNNPMYSQPNYFHSNNHKIMHHSNIVKNTLS